jgi:uncharacterized protein (DUF2252 family)
MDIRDSTRRYEERLRARMPLVAADLRAKHEAMAEAAFPFLRATFYRWAEVWPDECAALSRAPRVLAVGDLHVENFGTWRDDEGRLVWGINDFDEACTMPYTNDLVRLAASAVLAIREDRLACAPERACDAVLEGYSRALKAPGLPFILSERNRWLRRLAQNEVRDPKRFWKKLTTLAPMRGAVPPLVLRAIEEDLPDPVVERRMLHRRAGLGSLGRRRFTLLCRRNGAWIAREAKELTDSAWRWRSSARGTESVRYETVCRRAVAPRTRSFEFAATGSSGGSRRTAAASSCATCRGSTTGCDFCGRWVPRPPTCTAGARTRNGRFCPTWRGVRGSGSAPRPWRWRSP